jgi:hypothetical protein
MRELFRRRPWLWIVVFLGGMVVADIVLVTISVRNAPVSVKEP